MPGGKMKRFRLKSKLDKTVTKLVTASPPVVSAESGPCSDSASSQEPFPGATIEKSAQVVPREESVARNSPKRRASKRKNSREAPWARFFILASLLFVFCATAWEFFTDQSAHDYFLGKIATLANDPVSAVRYLDSAIRSRKDPFFYEARAEVLPKLHPPNDQGALNDLVAAVNLGSASYRTYEKAVMLALELRQPEVASRVMIACAKKPIEAPEAAALDLVLLGDKGEALKIVEATHGESQHLVRILLTRENQVKNIPEASIGENLLGLPTLFDDRVSDPHMVPLLQALLRLDKQEPAAAKEELQKSSQYYQEVSLMISCWILYEEGKKSECLKLSNDFDFSNDLKVMGRSKRAAMHLLRQHLFMELNEPDNAAKENAAYKRTRVSGEVFVPVPYRHWLKD